MENPFEDIVWLHDLKLDEQKHIPLGHGKYLSIILEHSHTSTDAEGRMHISRFPQRFKLNCALQSDGENLEFVEFDELDEFMEYIGKHSVIRQGV